MGHILDELAHHTISQSPLAQGSQPQGSQPLGPPTVPPHLHDYQLPAGTDLARLLQLLETHPSWVQTSMLSGTPNLPTGLNVTMFLENVAQVVNASANVAWTAPVTDTTHQAATSYIVRVKRTADSKWDTTTAGPTSVYLTGLVANVSYDFQVAAVNSAGISAFTATVTVTTNSDGTVPAVPTGLTAIKTPRGALISWNANSEPDLKGYHLQVSVNGGGYTDVTVDSLMTSFYWVAPSGTPGGTSLTFKILAVDWSGNFSVYSAPSSAIVTDSIVTGDMIGATNPVQTGLLSIVYPEPQAGSAIANPNPPSIPLGLMALQTVDQSNVTLFGASTLFSEKIIGFVTPLYTETYTFYVTTDDGARLWVNGVQLVNSWTLQGATTYSGTVALTAGTPYQIVLEHFQGTGGQRLLLEWQSASQARQTIPSSALSYSGAAQSALLGPFSVTTALIQNAAITNALIANLAVGTAQIQSLAVTDAKVANMVIDKLLAGDLTVFGHLTTGGWQTASSGARFVMDSASIRAYDGGSTDFGAGAGIKVKIDNAGGAFFAGTIKSSGVSAAWFLGDSAASNVPSLPSTPANGFLLDPVNGLRFWSASVLQSQFSSTGVLTANGASIYGSTIASTSVVGTGTNSAAGYKINGNNIWLFGNNGVLQIFGYSSAQAAWISGAAFTLSSNADHGVGAGTGSGSTSFSSYGDFTFYGGLGDLPANTTGNVIAFSGSGFGRSRFSTSSLAAPSITNVNGAVITGTPTLKTKSTDQAGQITLVLGNAAAVGTRLFDVTFDFAFTKGGQCAILITPRGGAAASYTAALKGTDTDTNLGFAVYANQAIAIGTYSFHYVCVGFE